jgi:hypothetical protein
MKASTWPFLSASKPALGLEMTWNVVLLKQFLIQRS